MNCGCEKKQEYGEPVMYIGDGITTEFPIPFGHLGDMITIKTPECGISVRVERDCAYQVVDGVVKFLTPPPKGTVVAFAPDGCLLNARGEWNTEKIYRKGDIITHDDICYFAKDTSCGAEPLTHSDKWLAVSGVSATLQIGTVTTAPAGTPASVTNRGTAREAILDFVIPGGAKGDKGDKGDKGEPGRDAVTVNYDISDAEVAECLTTDDTAYLYAITDREGRMLATCDEANHWKLSGTLSAETLSAGSASLIEGKSEYLYALVDAEGRILEAIDADGKRVGSGITNCITPDDFTGNDNDKLQAAFDALEETGGTILITRDMKITSTIYVGHLNGSGQLNVIGIGKGNTLSFGEAGKITRRPAVADYQGGMSFQNLSFEGVGNKTVFFGMLIHLYITNCMFHNAKNVVYADSNERIQDLYISNCYFQGVIDCVVKCDMNSFDVKFTYNRVDFVREVMNLRHSSGAVMAYNMIEGIAGCVFKSTGITHRLSIEDNYFESNSLRQGHDGSSVIYHFDFSMEGVFSRHNVTFKNNILYEPDTEAPIVIIKLPRNVANRDLPSKSYFTITDNRFTWSNGSDRDIYLTEIDGEIQQTANTVIFSQNVVAQGHLMRNGEKYIRQEFLPLEIGETQTFTAVMSASGDRSSQIACPVNEYDGITITGITVSGGGSRDVTKYSTEKYSYGFALTVADPAEKAAVSGKSVEIECVFNLA